MKGIVFAILTVCLLFTACDIEVSDNGDLDGFWQMTAQDTLATGGMCDMRSSKVFWAVQKDLLETTNYQTSQLGVLFRFKLENGKLHLSNPYLNDRYSSDIKVDDIEQIKPYGINNLEEDFSVIRLDDSQMILESSLLRLYFRRY